MNLSTPILISDRNEDFRSLLRDMLIKHGFFHLIEASNETETLRTIMTEKESLFILIQQDILSPEIIKKILHQNNFLVIGDPEKPQTVTLAARLGVKHILNFPFSSQFLTEKMRSIS